MGTVSVRCILFSKKPVYKKPNIKANKKFLALYLSFTRTFNTVAWFHNFDLILYLYSCLLTYLPHIA